MTTTDAEPTVLRRNILLRISYDGTRFHGWQKQLQHGKESFRTVQGEIERALALLHKHPVELFGSGRTDAGVHACGQAAHFFTDIARIKPDSFIPALNSALPKDIRIMEAFHVSDNLHARFSARSRTYRYFIHCGKTAFAHQLPYCWHIRREPDINLLNRMASVLSGELDCTTFSAAGDQSKSKSRYIYTARFFTDREFLVFEISANAFLWRMVRSITGTLLHYEQQNGTKEDFEAVLRSKDRRNAGETAPPQGLFLWSIEYPQNLLTPLAEAVIIG
ncbi:tRNA pseudouridine(38-40) synthase TruA [Treponema sp. OMZ 305]|uniref:tRNA pseudouridine(38-40) synthase TruA n=1 Tax=Treponema sp. OMZ 305 TaxID=1659192 RepID=UPI0020A4DC6E|nr:tRNA pseudouridine(38-40) synthase TruA [Treponema sp. OMZ 305]UTC58234.1 tRNA pseudouridine(38-40) synthase TruA [Treponema sp. OMZ 305]